MKVLKYIGIAVVGIVFLALVTALFVNGKYAVTRDITINKPKQEVFDYVKFLKNQNDFSVWAKIDPGMKTEFRGEDGTVGFVSAWDSKDPKAGKGEQKIIKIEAGSRIDYELHFIEPMESTDYATMSTEAISDNQTKVIWGFHGEMKYPMNLMCLFMDFEKLLGPDLENGLKNLKEIVEK
jgi:hypothetical protein